MRIRLLKNVSNLHGQFTAGAVVDWPENDARPLVTLGTAEEVGAESAAPETEYFLPMLLEEEEDD